MFVIVEFLFVTAKDQTGTERAGGGGIGEEDDEKAAEASAAGGAAAASDGLEMNPVGGSKASQVDDAMPGDGDDGR